MQSQSLLAFPVVLPQGDEDILPTEVGVEIELRCDDVDGNPINIWDLVDGSNNPSGESLVEGAGILTNEAGLHVAEFAVKHSSSISQIYTRILAHQAWVQNLVGSEVRWDFSEFDEVLSRPVKLDDWAPKTRYVAMLKAYREKARRQGEVFREQGFLDMVLWRSTHFNIGLTDEHKAIVLLDILNLVSPWAYTYWRDRLGRPATRRVLDAYGWEPKGFEPGWRVFGTLENYFTWLTAQRRLVRSDSDGKNFEVDLETPYQVGDNVSEIHHWARLRPGRVEWRVMFSMSPTEVVHFLNWLRPVLQNLLELLELVPERAPSDVRSMAFNALHRRWPEVFPVSEPDEAEWNRAAERCCI